MTQTRVLHKMLLHEHVRHHCYRLVHIHQKMDQSFWEMIETIELCANAAKAEFDCAVKHKGKTCFVTPNIKISRTPQRYYITLRWARLENETYRNATQGGWNVREIKKRGQHYSEHDFKRVMTESAFAEFWPYIRETEHLLRYLRLRYEQANDIFKLIRQLKPQWYQCTQAYDVGDFGGHVNAADIAKYEEWKKAAMLGQFDCDPLSLPKSLALIDFQDGPLPPPVDIDFDDDDIELEL